MGGIIQDIAEHTSGAAAIGFLAEVGSLVTSPVDHKRALQKVARRAVPQFADACLIDLASDLTGALTNDLSDAEGDMLRVAAAHVVPELRDEIHNLKLNYAAADAPPARVLRNRQPLRINGLGETDLHSLAADDEGVAGLSAISPKALMMVPLVSRDRCLGTVAFFSTTTGRHFSPADRDLLERVADRLAVAIENAQLSKHLRETDQRKDLFLAMLAHELRNPLGAISNGLEILRLTTHSSAGSDSAAWAFEMMERQKQHLTHLLDDLLDVSRLSRGKIALRRNHVPLAGSLRSALQTLSPDAVDKKQKLTVDIACDDAVVSADPERLQQIVSNLLANAIKYTPEGGEIKLSADREGSEVVIAVSDTGAGISAADLTGIFELFTQVRSNQSTATNGLGLGLALVRDLTELHGGRVTAESPGLGKGSTFTVRLPIAAKSATAYPDKQLHDESSAVTGLNILAVDDNEDSVTALERLLEQDGHQVRVVHDGQSAIRAVGEQKPDLLLLDLGLPDICGEHVAESVRSNPANESIHIVALTGYGQPRDRERTAAAGFDAHLIKPLDFAALDAIVRSLQRAKETSA